MNEYKRTINEKLTFSQAGQDLFCSIMNGEKKDGIYLEIGGSHPYESNNTFLLESKYNWKGYSIEINKKETDFYNLKRKNLCLNHDATNFDYIKLFKEKNFPKQIDYLSIDIEPAENTLKALKALPLDKYRFSVITYEHDNYVSGPKCMEESRNILKSLGYKLVVSNVISNKRDFEDWYVDPNVISEEIWSKYVNEKIDFFDIFDR